MAEYIMQIFRAYAMVVFSWGFNTPTAIANGLRFKVQGFKFKGTVEVVCIVIPLYFANSTLLRRASFTTIRPKFL